MTVNGHVRFGGRPTEKVPIGNLAGGRSHWIPRFELLEERGFTVLLVNARHVKNVRGRKSDVLDCQWLQQLHTFGLLSGAFRPADEIVVLRSSLRRGRQ